MRAASRASFGRRYLNRGRRNTVEVLWWWLDLDGRRIRDGGKSRRSVPRILTLFLAAQSLDDLLWRDGDLVDPDAQGVVDGRTYCRRHGEKRALPRLLRPKRTLAIDRLDDVGLDVRHVEERWRLVLEHRRPFVQTLPKDLLLHQRLAEAHVNAAFDLALDEQRVDGAANVVRDPDL